MTKRDFGRLGAGRDCTFRQLLNMQLPAMRNALCSLFRRLGRYFRGNLFEDISGLHYFRNEDLATVRNLINGDELLTKQRSLPFDVYDFSVIPIEVISAVYEDFLRAEDPEEQKRTGAFYTPPKLVDFTMDLATELHPTLLGKTVLDPGCGSGVFLVSAFNRMAEEWCRANPNARNGTRAAALARILQDNIRGVDVSLIACQATCFSLYMAMLDFLEPREIRRLGPGRLPRLMVDRKTKSPAQTVTHANFLSGDPSIARDADLVVGNPPWVARGNVETSTLAGWRLTHDEQTYPVPANQIACAFLWEVPNYMRDSGTACLLLPAGLLTGVQTDNFQKRWFSSYSPDVVMNLSDLRFFLFPTANHPTIAIRFSSRIPSTASTLSYITPKATLPALFDDRLFIEPDDRKEIRIRQVLSYAEEEKASALWLGFQWATPRDREFIDRLCQLPPLSDLVGEPNERKRWVKGQGFQPAGVRDRLPKRPDWPEDFPFVSARTRFRLLLSHYQTVPLKSELQGRSLRRRPDSRLFKSPLVLFNQGFSNFAFSPFDVSFKDSLQAIAGSDTDRALLQLLTAFFLSPLASYLAFHTTSKASYRYPLLEEVLRFPFPLPEESPSPWAEEVVSEVASIFEWMINDVDENGFHRINVVDSAVRDLGSLVFRYYDVSADEKILIEDTVACFARSATPSRSVTALPTLKMSSVDQRQNYVRVLLDAFRQWTAKDGPGPAVQVWLSQSGAFAVVSIDWGSSHRGFEERPLAGEVSSKIEQLILATTKRVGNLEFARNLSIIEGRTVYIVKPLQKRYWLGSAGLNDADVIAGELLKVRGTKDAS